MSALGARPASCLYCLSAKTAVAGNGSRSALVNLILVGLLEKDLTGSFHSLYGYGASAETSTIL